MGKKSVKFPEEEEQLAQVVCTIPQREEFTPEELAALFFNRDDYQMTRNTARIISKEAERYGLAKCLDDTFCEKSLEVQNKLNEWVARMSSGSSRDGKKSGFVSSSPTQASKRGLERWANTRHGEDRQQDQFTAIMAVLRAQDEAYARGVTMDPERLRKVSHKATKTARHFARMMGKADSYAMAQELRAEQKAEAAKLAKMSSVSDDGSGLTECMSTMTVGSDTMSVITCETSATSASYLSARRKIEVPAALLEDIDVEPLGGVDELKDSRHEKFRSLRRFGFGRHKHQASAPQQQQPGGSKKSTEARVSRVA